jgi:hypothetical protein
VHLIVFSFVFQVDRSFTCITMEALKETACHNICIKSYIIILIIIIIQVLFICMLTQQTKDKLHASYKTRQLHLSNDNKIKIITQIK